MDGMEWMGRRLLLQGLDDKVQTAQFVTDRSTRTVSVRANKRVRARARDHPISSSRISLNYYCFSRIDNKMRIRMCEDTIPFVSYTIRSCLPFCSDESESDVCVCSFIEMWLCRLLFMHLTCLPSCPFSERLCSIISSCCLCSYAGACLPAIHSCTLYDVDILFVQLHTHACNHPPALSLLVSSIF